MIEQRQFKKVRFSDCMKTVAVSVGLAVSAIIPSFVGVILLGTITGTILQAPRMNITIMRALAMTLHY